MRPDRVTSWRNGELLIDKQPLAEAIAEVKRYHKGMVIVLADLSKATRVSGVFRTDPRPDDALAAGANLQLTYLLAGVWRLRPAAVS